MLHVHLCFNINHQFCSSKPTKACFPLFQITSLFLIIKNLFMLWHSYLSQCMFVLLSSITRPGCRGCSPSVVQSEVSHRASAARHGPTSRRRRQRAIHHRTSRATVRDVVHCHPVQAILASLSLPHRYTPINHTCNSRCHSSLHSLPQSKTHSGTFDTALEGKRSGLKKRAIYQNIITNKFQFMCHLLAHLA